LCYKALAPMGHILYRTQVKRVIFKEEMPFMVQGHAEVVSAPHQCY